MAEKLLVLDKIEDILDKNGNLIGKQVFNAQGESVKVKKGQEDRLKERWDQLKPGLAYKFIMGEYKGFPFVQDFELVKDTFLKEAIEKVANDSEVLKRQSIESQNAANVISQEHIWKELDKGTQLAIIAWALNKMGIGVTHKVPPDPPARVQEERRSGALQSKSDMVKPESNGKPPVERSKPPQLDEKIWGPWFKKALPLVQLTHQDLIDLGLPAKDARKVDQFHYVKDILDDDQRKLLFKKMNEQLDPENQIAL